MSSDPKKPGFDAPPAGTPDLLQKDLNLDRRRRVPTFEELQVQKADAQTDPLRPATPRPPAPIPNATVPARPSNLDEITQAAPRHVPPGLALRQPPQPALHIRTPTPPTQPARMAVPIDAVPTMQQPTAPHPRPMPPTPQQQARPPMPPQAQQARPPMPPQAAPQQARPPMPPQAAPQQARPPMPPQAAPQQARPPMPPPPAAAAARPVPSVPTGPQTNTIPVRTPAPVAQPNSIPQRTPVPQQQVQPPRPPIDATGVVPPQRVAPPSPTEFAQARPQVMPQVTPAGMMQGAAMPDGQPVAQRPSQAGLKPVPAYAPPAPRAVEDEPEPLTVPAGSAAPRSFTPPPAPAPVPRPAGLPAEMLVTQPGSPGPFAPSRQSSQQPKIELAALGAPTSAAPAHVPAQPVFEAPHFDEPRASSDTVTAEPAAMWRRTGAWVTDLLIVGGMVLGLLMAAMTVIAPKGLTAIQQLTAVAIPGAALGAILAFVYTTLFAFLWSGRTPGRRLMGIHLVDSTGHAPSFARAMFRAVFSLVSFGFFLSGFWLALFDRHGQTLHDKLTRTFVVKLQDA